MDWSPTLTEEARVLAPGPGANRTRPRRNRRSDDEHRTVRQNDRPLAILTHTYRHVGVQGKLGRLIESDRRIDLSPAMDVREEPD